MKRSGLQIIPILAFGAGAVALALAFSAVAADPVLLEAMPPDPPAQEAEAVPGELIVRFSGSAPASARATTIAHSGSKLARDLPLPGYSLVQVPPGREQEFADKLRATPGVRSVEPNLLRYALFEPNDEHYSFQWNFPKIGLPAAWDSVTGSGVTVAVIDTGVAYEDCAAAVCGAEFFKAPDFQGTSFVAPFDFVDGDTHANDEHGHGTHVAGTIAQATNNGVGVAGIAFNASIMPVRVLDANGSGSMADVIDGIMWAANNGADVINLSLGSSGSGAAEEAAVDYAVSQGVVVVAAAGNSNSSTLLCPACYPSSIAVSATRFDDTRAYYSSYGTGLGGHTLDLAAPGGDVTVDQNTDGYSDGVLQQTYRHFCDPFVPTDYSVFAYCFAQGTSMASPHVAGVAALVMSANQALTPQEVRDILTSTALDVGAPGYDLEYGHGRLDAAAAVSEALTPGATPPPSATPTSVPTATPTPTPTAIPPLPDTPTPTATTPAIPSATPTPTPTAIPPLPDTPTPTAGPSVDSDLDGCTDEQELDSDPFLGGQRDPANPWDFFDTPDQRNIRDKNIASEDLFRVLVRFGTEGDPLIDPFSPPPATGYHPAFDRGSLVGPNPWNLGPADGSITSLEIFAVFAQFGHSCA